MGIVFCKCLVSLLFCMQMWCTEVSSVSLDLSTPMKRAPERALDLQSVSFGAVFFTSSTSFMDSFLESKSRWQRGQHGSCWLSWVLNLLNSTPEESSSPFRSWAFCSSASVSLSTESKSREPHSVLILLVSAAAKQELCQQNS